MRHLLLSCAALAALLTACGGPAATSGVTKSAERSSGPFGLAKADAVQVDTADAFKNTKQVVISGFTVGFATYKTDSSKAGGGLMGSGFGGKSTAKSTLKGVDDATMQSITETAYKDFVSELKAQGYTVVDRSQLANNPEYAKTKSYPSPYEDSQGGIFGAKSKTKFFAPSSFSGLKSIGDVPGLMGGFAFDNPMHSQVKFAKESGIKTLNVVYVLDFANSEKYGSWATSTSNVNVGQGMSLIPEYSKLTLLGGDGGTFSSANGSIKLGQPINSDKSFAKVTDSTSDTARGVEVATNIVGALGGIGTNATREFEFVATPAQYKVAANDVLKQANDTIIGKMASLQ